MHNSYFFNFKNKYITMRKRILLTIATMLLTAGNITANAADSIILWRANGEKITINIGERPKLTFVKGEVIITTAKGSVAYPAQELQRCTYESTADGIEGTTASKMPTLTMDGNSVTITGLPSASQVAVYSVNGLQLGLMQANSSGKATVSTTSMQEGVYIIKTAAGNFKIRKP